MKTRSGFGVGVALDLAAFNDSFLRGYSHLIIDRDSKYTTEFQEILKENDVDVVPIPPKSPNCNPHAERFVRSVKEECLDHSGRFRLAIAIGTGKQVLS